MNNTPTYKELEQKIKKLEKEIDKYKLTEKRRIDEQKKYEDALIAREDRYRVLFNSINDAIFVHQPTTEGEPGKFIEVNDVACRRYGYTREEFLELTPLDIIYPGQTPARVIQARNRVKQILSKRQDIFEGFHRTKSDKRFPVELSSYVFDLKGEITILSIVRDITQRKEVETALRESEEKFRLISEQSLMGIIITQDGLVKYHNDAFLKITGYSTEEVMNWGPFDHVRLLFDPVYHKLAMDRAKKLQSGIEEEHIPNFEVNGKKKSGEEIWIESFTRLTVFQGKRAILSSLIDITERKRAEEALRESEEKYRQLFELGSDAVFLIDIETGHTLEVNSTVEKLYGYSREELLHKRNLDITVEPERTIEAVVDNQTQIPIRYHRKKDGAVFPVEITSNQFLWAGKRVYIAAIRDITFRLEAEEERRHLETQLQQAQKMEAIGTLAGGIAHDFNNLLMGIQGRTSLMLTDVDTPHANLEHLKGIEEYVRSATDLTKQLLGFARGGKYEVRPINLNELLKKSADMFGRTTKEITIHRKYQENIWTVNADQGQIEQVLVNLYVNAWQSMPNGGDLFLETSNIVINENYTKPFEVKPGKYVKISITDTGMGMDKATKERIFEPFFTTKEMGRGAGLGLASVYGIIKNHNGIINVYSEKGEGSTFNIYLSASEKEIIKDKDFDSTLKKGTETILLVDDEEMIRDIGNELLKMMGYKVLTAQSGKEALELYHVGKNRIDMIILDMIMPEMGGGMTYEKLKKIDPDVKVLLSSGYSITGTATEILKQGCNGFIQKPFNTEQLSEKIREILDNR